MELLLSKADKLFRIPEVSLCVYFRCRRKGMAIIYKESAQMTFVIDKQAGTCQLTSINELAVNRTYSKADKLFRIPEVSLCVYFRCRRKGMAIIYKESGCQYGDTCVSKVPNEEGRSYYCLINLEVVKKVKDKEPGRPPILFIDYRLYNGFIATPEVSFVSTFDKKTRTCTIYNQTVLRGDPIDVTAIPGMDPCAVVTCGKRGLQYQPEESGCSVEGVGCRTTYELGCTLYTCTRTVLFSKGRRGSASSSVVNSWMRRALPSCEYEGQCVKLLEVLENAESPPCSHLACLESAPGIPKIQPSQTGCLEELLGDQCVGLGEMAGHLVPAGPLIGPESMLDDETCVDYLCSPHVTDPYKPQEAVLVPGEYGCRDEDLADTFPDNEEPYGCFRQGVITERNCTRLTCVFGDGVATINSKQLEGRCIDETGQCRSPGDAWVTEDGRRCVCNLGGGEPNCSQSES